MNLRAVITGLLIVLGVAWQPTIALESLRLPDVELPTAATASAPKPEHKNTGFLDLNLYRDTREFNVFTMNAGAKLPHKFEYFQLLNLFGPEGGEQRDFGAFFTEINLRRPIADESPWLQSLDWTIQLADGSIPREVIRLGIRWRLHDTAGPLGDFMNDVLKLKYSAAFHLIETDGSGWQIEHVYRRNFFDGKAYVGGFVDHNIDANGSRSAWVTEHQIGVKVSGPLYLVAEYRYASFASPVFKSGWGFGIEYVIKFP